MADYKEVLSKIKAEMESEPEFIPLKDHKYVVVSKVAYLAGIDAGNFGPGRNFQKDIYDSMRIVKSARIVRNLCRIRTAIELNYKNLNLSLKNGKQNVLYVSEFIPQDAVAELTADGVRNLSKDGAYPYKVVIEINRVLQDRINNCKSMFPTWVNWEYIKSLFIMPNGTTQQGTQDEANKFYAYKRNYPYKQYLNIIPDDNGNILYNDKKFLELVYQWNGDEFTDVSKVMDVSGHVKNRVFAFIDGAGEGKLDFIVDCENSDPFNLICMLYSLELDGTIDKIAKLILVNDVNTTPVWATLSRYTDIPVEHIMTERVKDNKSLVDSILISKVFEEFYEEGIGSFVLLSSDSDYWALIKSLKKANFLVMVEHSKCSPALKDAMENEGIFYCYLDDFYSGSIGDDIKNRMILNCVKEDLKTRSFNLKQVFEDALEEMYVQMPEATKKQFYAKYIKTMTMSIADDGTVLLELKDK